MYRPQHFREDRIDVLGAFLREHRLATLVSLGDTGLVATHLPLLWDPEPAPFGTLTGHFARANPHWKVPEEGPDALAVFLGPHAYISPSWYPSKREHGRVVPTWNYLTVHAYGPLRRIDDPAWLRSLVTRLTDAQERDLPEPWVVTDAPEPFLGQMLRGIIGIEIPIRRLEGKWKLSQNRPAGDFSGTIRGLVDRNEPAAAAIAEAMAAVRRRDEGGGAGT